MCQKINVFLSLCDKIVLQRGIFPLLFLQWEVDSFPSLTAEVWLWSCRKRKTRVLAFCWRSPMWYQISTGNQDHHVVDSWEVSAAASLSSKSSISGVLKGSNRKIMEGSFIPSIWMLSWNISLSNLLHAKMSYLLFLFSQECYLCARESMCSVVTEVLQQSKLCYQNLRLYHSDWKRLGWFWQWLAFSSGEGAGLPQMDSCQSSSSLLSSAEMFMRQSTNS